jgi:hypothetical protein
MSPKKVPPTEESPLLLSVQSQERKHICQKSHFLADKTGRAGRWEFLLSRSKISICYPVSSTLLFSNVCKNFEFTTVQWSDGHWPKCAYNYAKIYGRYLWMWQNVILNLPLDHIIPLVLLSVVFLSSASSSSIGRTQLSGTWTLRLWLQHYWITPCTFTSNFLHLQQSTNNIHPYVRKW